MTVYLNRFYNWFIVTAKIVTAIFMLLFYLTN